MQVKKFEAPTMQEALKVIKRELGPEAIILSTKHIKSGFGLMSKASVEVTAAIAEKDLKKKTMAEKNLPQEVKEKIWNSKAEKQSEIYNTYFEKQLSRSAKDRVEIGAAKARSSRTDDAIPQRKSAAAEPAAPVREKRYADIEDEAPAPKRARFFPDTTQSRAPSINPIVSPPPSQSSRQDARSLEKEIEELKGMVAEISSNNSSGATAYSKEDNDGFTDELVSALHDLVSNGVEKKFARNLLRSASFDLSSMDKHDSQAIADRVAYQMLRDIQVQDLLEGVGAASGRQETSIVALVGPTGVGKTTTIAKIASLGILEKKLRVGLINLDSYKVAAADQLSTYAKIMNIPFRSVTSKEELQQAVYDFSTLDLVLIDTTGRSQKDQESLLQLRHLLANISGCRNVLMVSATTKDSDMNEVVSRFKLFNPTGLVFSKLDETSVYGCIYNTQKRSGLPLLYFTVGQRVPEDIEKASAERVVDLVLDI